jgi:multisubunit Na+/H+ antiporter MnhF subunit
MNRIFSEETILSLFVLAMAAISPNLWPAASAGYGGMPFFAKWLLVPSIIIILIIFGVAWFRHHVRLFHRMLVGGVVGFIGTIGLEIIRQIGFHLGWMPGDMPRLLGVLITHRFMLGPSTLSDILGYAYHFWNGICFGFIFSLIVGRKPFYWGIIYALLIGTGFLLSPSVQSMGIGFMGTGLPGMIETVYVAHLVYGSVMGYLDHKWLRHSEWLFSQPDSRVREVDKI